MHCCCREQPSAALRPLCACPAIGPVGNYDLISARRPGSAAAPEHPHNEELQMRGKAWPVSGLPARVSQRPVAAARPSRYFWHHYCAGAYKAAAVAVAQGAVLPAAQQDMPQRCSAT